MFRIGDEVAVLVTPNEVRQLARIVHVGPAVVELNNGELYFSDDGKAMHATRTLNGQRMNTALLSQGRCRVSSDLRCFRIRLSGSSEQDSTH